jgi:prepilin-type N-terminal cleavage/methylation domain-containing protein
MIKKISISNVPNRSVLMHTCCKRGVTLIELTVVILVLLALIGTSMYAIGGYRKWQKQSEAETALRSVYTAQRTYLAEHPTKVPSTLTDDDISEMKKYLSDGSGEWPVVEDLDGTELSYNVKVSPPVFTNDPSGDDNDGKWDLGEK